MTRRSRKSSRALPAAIQLPSAEAMAATALLPLAVMLGGASAGGFVANAALQFLSALVIAWGIATLEWAPENKGERVPLLLALALLGWMLIQLIPLPPALWTQLPGRARVVEGLSALGVNPLPWMPISLVPARTWSGVAAMLPVIAALVLALRVSRNGAQAALWALFVVAVVSVLMGLGQLSGGADSPLYLYAVTNYGNAVGFFSNSNHLATLMLLVLPLVAALVVRARARWENTKRATVVWVAAPATALLALLGLLAAGSVAGLALALVALVAAFLILRPVLSGRAQIIGLGIGVLTCAALVGVVLLSPAGADFGQTSFGSEGMSRPHMWGIAREIIPSVQPFGTGFGSFPEVFRQFEDPATVGVRYANHAHSDLIETVIEGGVVSVVLLLVFLLWYVRRLWTLWMSYSTRDPVALGASVAVGLVLLHSLVDYPLRTAAIAVPFAFCLGLMARMQRQTASIAAETPTTTARHLSVV